MTSSHPLHIPDEATRQRRLDGMKRRATGLLVLSALVFLIARLLEPRHPWLGWVRATAEAAMVGGIADWFAVTALFRHPLGIPIPHTAIVPARKDRIGQSLGGFVQNNFLSREVVGTRLALLHPGERLARWLTHPANAQLVARHAATALAGATRALGDEDVQRLIDRAIVERIRAIPAAPLVGNVLALVAAEERHHEMLDRAVALLARLVAENETLIRERIREESPWWIPERVDDRIHDKILSGIETTLAEVRADPEHPLRARYDAALHDLVERLRTSPATLARGEVLKEAMLEHPAVRQFSASLWSDVKERLLHYAERSGESAPGSLERGLMALGHAVLDDAALLATVDGWITDAALDAVERYRGEVGQLIAQTIAAWDPEATTRRIELQIGRDLQFIRINGTVVGGLVGLALYALSVLL